ncbi:MAG: sigma-54 dependent transcriptional regulator [bacterium]
MSKVKILLLEPEEKAGEEIREFLVADGHTVCRVGDEEACREALDQEIYDVMIYETKLPANGVLDLVEHSRKVNSFGLVICLCDSGDMGVMLEAMEKGADAYIKRPFQKEELRITLHRLLDYRSLVGANFYLRRTQDLIYRFDDIIGDSPELKKVLSIVKKVAFSNASVLIEGETGTGKELIAGAIHYNSSRKDKNFIKVNCAALQDTLLESELFGHEKGAFTGADKQRVGRFEQANFGTIFLDEIADMSASTQAKVLRVLQEQEFERVGGTKTIKVDVRVLSATNKALKELIGTRKFRDDLYYRLNVVTIYIPPLRERRADILPLAYYFLRRFSGELSKKIKGFSPDAERVLENYGWLGNIRELRNTIERSVLLCEQETVRAEDLFLCWNDGSANDNNGGHQIQLPSDGVRLVDMEKMLVLDALEKANWVQKEAARFLGISRRVMHYKIQKFGIRNPNWVRNR